MQLLIYGARSLALGAYHVIRECAPAYQVVCFLVTSLEKNPTVLAGLPVQGIASFTSKIGPAARERYHILIATPEDQHPEIVQTIKKHGYCNYTCLDSKKMSQWMEAYFTRQGTFLPLHSLHSGREKAMLRIWAAQFYKDRSLKNKVTFPIQVQPLQAGAALTDMRIAEVTDNTGENISIKNANYCELTALYWLWKNKLTSDFVPNGAEYYGLFHYRRFLDLTEEDLFRLKANRVDAVLPFPTLHEPDILEHHQRYLSESDWQAMKKALAELYPEYIQMFPQIFSQPYFYNYNLILARKQVLADYCAWLFPILERTEQLSDPKGWQRRDRYIGYLGENLMTLYFLSHKESFRIYHVGCLMYT